MYVNKQIALRLQEKGYSLRKVIKQYPGCGPLFYTLEYDDENWSECDAYFLPSIEEVKEWLYIKHNIFYVLDRPFFTYGLATHVAYLISIYKINEENSSIDLIWDEAKHGYEGGSEEVQTLEAIKVILSLI